MDARIRMHIRSWLCLAFAVALFACGGGGGGGDSSDTSTPRLPVQGDPEFGSAGQVLGSDRGRSNDEVVDQLWVGFNRHEQWNSYLQLKARLEAEGVVPFVGGRVVADPNHPLGFYFDPDTTAAAEVTSETVQITLEGLRNDPEGSAAAGHPWFVGLVAERVVPATAE